MKKIIAIVYTMFLIVLVSGLVAAADLTPNVPEENIRAIPNGKTVIGTARKGSRLEKVKEKDGWTKVRFEGWIYSPSLRSLPPDPNKKVPVVGSDAFDVLHWNWKQIGNMLRIQGVVQNDSENFFKSVKVILTVLDGNNKPISSNYTYLQSEDIRPNQVNGFKVYLKDVKVPDAGPHISFKFEYE
ncbi:MAG: hypothetical protein HQM14_05660 [SAR324 cluster bacterium]|nr:hypothetical protein [SAR324 cluster bacterium]